MYRGAVLREAAERERSVLGGDGDWGGAVVAGAKGKAWASGTGGVRCDRGPSPSMQAELLDVSPLIVPSALIALERHFQRVVIARKRTAA